MVKFLGRMMEPQRSFTTEYLAETSKTDEHYIRLYENIECCMFENIGAPMAIFSPPLFAGMCIGTESLGGLERDWNAIETKCVGLGDPYCEFKVVPREIDELQKSLEKDSSVVERVHQQVMQHLTGFLIEGKPLIERPSLGSDVHFHVVWHVMGFAYLAGERYQTALRMGGAKARARALEEPSCYFTTGFLNGFFSTVKNQHVKEIKCLAMGDSHCEWEFR